MIIDCFRCVCVCVCVKINSAKILKSVKFAVGQLEVEHIVHVLLKTVVCSGHVRVLFIHIKELEEF